MAIDRYARSRGYRGSEYEDFEAIMLELDEAYVAYMATKTKAEQTNKGK